MKLTWMPQTLWGKLSLILILSSMFMIGVFYLILFLFDPAVPSGFLSAPMLVIPILFAGITGITALFVGHYAIIFRKERAILMLFPILLGWLILIFALGEFMGA